MLSSQDHSGLITSLIGIIAVVMVAVGFSVVTDIKFSVPRSPQALNAELSIAEQELQNLDSNRKRLATRLTLAEERVQQANQQLATIRATPTAQTKHLETLTSSRDHLRQDIPLIEEKFVRYRANYRKQTWDRAVGQDLGTVTAGGREYRRAVIKRVTEVGLEIDYEGGMARIHAPDLDPAIRERFQWDAGERSQRLREESSHQRAVMGDGRPKPPAKLAAPPTAPPIPATANLSDPARVKGLRSAVVQAAAKVQQISTHLSDARNAVAAGQKVVPGTLETWGSRIARIETSLAAAKHHLVLAKANLAAVAPADPAAAP